MTDEKKKGVIFDIQRWSLHDGPGIRTNVFFKGCPLSCQWCSNPESQEFCREPALFGDKCIHCLSCVEHCPHGAIHTSDPWIRLDYEICRGRCSRGAEQENAFCCTKACYAQALTVMGEVMTADMVLEEVMRDEGIYRSSGGGVTMTGGEPLAQPEFLLELLTAAKERGLHTVMESSMFAEWDKIQACLPYLDVLFMDMKLLPEEKHVKYTGVSNQIILDNIRRAAAYARTHRLELAVRTPVIPGLNDTSGDIAAMADWIKKHLPGVERYELLPYHRLGRGKYRNIGREYQLGDIVPPSKEKMKELEAVVSKLGLRRE